MKRRIYALDLLPFSRQARRTRFAVAQELVRNRASASPGPLHQNLPFNKVPGGRGRIKI